VEIGWPSRAITATFGTPRKEQAVFPVLLKSSPPASDEDEPPNLVNSTEADTDDGVQAIELSLGFGALVVGDVVCVADGPPEQAESRPSEAAQRTDATRTLVRGPGPEDPNPVMPVSPPTEGESGRGRWPGT
jgi:hypothetical protein